jgi:glycosyltransferase involved in cell wall biosynthesis
VIVPPNDRSGGGPLVSLIMPVWQPRPEWLREAVASALGQRGCSIELIVVDNGNDAPVSDQLAGLMDSRLRTLRIAHGGVSRARNAGMAEARGAFVRFVDCDDVLEPDSTRRLLDLGPDGRTITYGATEYCDAEMRPYKIVTCALQGSIVEHVLTDFTVTLPAILFPRQVVDLVGAWDEAMTMCEDWDFVARALEHAPVRGDTQVAIRYRRHATSAVARASIDLSERSAARVIERYVARHPEHRESPWVRRAHAIRLTHAGDRYLHAGNRAAALSRFGTALRTDPAYTLRVISGIVRRKVRARTPYRAASTSRGGPAA